MEREKGSAGRFAMIALALALLFGVQAWAYTVPTGWMPVNRDRAKWMMGQIYMYRGVANTNPLSMVVTGLAANDVLAGVVNLSDVSEDQIPVTTITVAANKLTVTTGWTAGEYYMVLVKRPQAQDR